jgi:hypothetical protein
MPVLNDVLAGSLAQAVQVQQIIDALKGTPNKGVPVSLVSLNDSTNYALTVQNDDSTNSRALLVLKSDGTTLIAADATGVTLGSPVNLPSGSINGGTALADASVTNAKLGPDVARANLLTNGGLEIWQRGASFSGNGVFTADRWLMAFTGGTMTVTQETTTVDGPSGTSAKCVLSGVTTPNYLTQHIADSGVLLQLRGRTLSASIRVQCSVANAARLYLQDTAAQTLSSFHSGNGTWQTLTVTKAIDNAAGWVRVGVDFALAGTFYIDNACLVVGSQPANYVPLHPADDLARCLRYYEIIGETAGSIQSTLYASAASQSPITFIPYKARKAVVPTVTKVGTWTVSNCGQPGIGAGPGIDGFSLYATSIAAGMVGFGNNSAGNFITAEANP